MNKSNALDVSGIAQKLSTTSTPKEVYRLLVREVAETLAVSRCIFVPSENCLASPNVPIEWSMGIDGSEDRDRLLVELAYYLQDISVSVTGMIDIEDALGSKILFPVHGTIKKLDIFSVLSFSLGRGDFSDSCLILFQEEEKRYWSKEEKDFLESLKLLIQKTLTRIAQARKLDSSGQIDSEYLSTFYKASHLISQKYSLDKIVLSLIEHLSNSVQAKTSFCFLGLENNQSYAELVSSHNLSKKIILELGGVKKLDELSKYFLNDQQENRISDLNKNQMPVMQIFAKNGFSSALFVAIVSKGKLVGVLAVLSDKKESFTNLHIHFVRAISQLIGIAHYESQLLEQHSIQKQSLATLYRMSHELSRPLTLDDLFQQAFKVIRDELGLKRLWVGLLNDPGTRIIGQAAYGPGLRKNLVEVSVELESPDNPIVKVIESKSPLVIDDPEQVLKAFGVKRIFSRLEISSIILVPLIAGGQLHGVMAVQPQTDSKLFNQGQISLLMSLASEVAAMVLSKRLEERLASGEKMRTAALLAAGIAHNFNNILQAIMGQASLLEMQSGLDSSIEHATKVIKDAAQKGALLVKQLLSVANLEDPHREICNINAVIEQSLEELTTYLHEGQEIHLDLDSELPKVYVDSRHLTRILRTLIQNSAEAMDDTGIVEIFTDSVNVGPESPHYEVPYGSFVRVGVRDNGIGMDSEMKRRCFEPFFTTKDVDPGSGLSLSGAGLGLAAAYSLSRRNGGRLVVDSRPGHGTLFTLYVRVADQKAISDEDLMIEESFFENPKLTSIENYQKQRLANKDKA